MVRGQPPPLKKNCGCAYVTLRIKMQFALPVRNAVNCGETLSFRVLAAALFKETIGETKTWMGG